MKSEMMKKKFSSLTAKLAALLLAFTCAGTAWGALSGTGTEADPFQIATLADLQEFRDAVNTGTTYEGQYVKLTADIDLSAVDNWTPIGEGTRKGAGNCFAGTFDGNSQTISGLKISSYGKGDDYAIGLFGLVKGGTVKDFAMTGVSITINSSSQYAVGSAVGAVYGSGMVSGVSVTSGSSVKGGKGVGGVVGMVTNGGTVSGCSNAATVEALTYNSGGVVGSAYCTTATTAPAVENCSNSGSVSGKTGVGGVVGLSSADVSGCSNTASVTGSGTSVGGVIGEQKSYGTVSGNTNSGKVTNNGGGYGTGGIIGWIRYENSGSYVQCTRVSVLNNTNTGSVSGGNDAGGIVGTVYHTALVSGNTNKAQSLSGTNFAAGIVGNFQIGDGGEPADNTNVITMTGNTSETDTAKITANHRGNIVYDNSTGANSIIVGNTPSNQDKANVVASATVNGVTTACASLMEAINAAYNGGTVEVLADVTVEHWHQNIWTLVEEEGDFNTSPRQREPLVGPNNLTIHGNGHTLTVNAIDSAGNGNRLFSGAKNLNIDNYTIDVKNGAGIGMDSGMLDTVSIKTPNGNTLLPGANCKSAADYSADIAGVTVKNCTLDGGTGSPFYVNENGRAANFKISGSTLKSTSTGTIAILRGNEVLEDCTIESPAGSKITLTNGGVAGPATITGNNFGETGLKIYSANNCEDATITGNVFSSASVIKRDGTDVVNLSENYWGDGSAPSFTDSQYVVVDSYYQNYDTATGTLSNLYEVPPVATVTINETTTKYTDLNKALTAAVTAGQDATVTICAENFENKTLDLSGSAWSPVSLNANNSGKFVTVEGSGAILTGLSDMLFFGTWAGKTGLVIKDLTIKDSTIVHDAADAKGNVGVGAFIGWPQATETVTLSNCHLVNSKVEGGHWTGGLIGIAAGYSGTDGPVFETVTITGCSVENSTITGKGSAGGIIGHGAASDWTKVIITDTTVTGNTVKSTGSYGDKAGAVCGTVGAAGQEKTVNGVTHEGGIELSADVSNNTVTSGTTDKGGSILGRIGSKGGELAVTGGTYDGTATYADDTYDSDLGEIIISGGSFKTVPSSDAVVEGYTVEGTPNAEGFYTVVVDPTVAKIGETKYESLATALAAVGANSPLTWVKSSEWPSTTPVYYNGNFYATLTAAINAANTANASTAALIYVRPNYSAGGKPFVADHDNIKTSITIYGNNASIGCAWEPTIEYDGASYHTLTKDVTFALYNLHDGAGAWGYRTSTYTSTVIMCNCTNAHEVLLNGSVNANSGNNIWNIKNCTFNASGLAAQPTVGSMYPVTLTMEGCTFTGLNGNYTVNMNNKCGGTTSATITDCTFDNCGTSSKGTIRLNGETAEATVSGTLSNLTFLNSNNICDIQIGHATEPESNNATVNYTVSGTTGVLKVFETGSTTLKNDGETSIVAANNYSGDNAALITGSGTQADPYIIANIDALKAFRDRVNAGNTYAGKFFKLAANVDLNNEEWDPIGSNGKTFKGTFNGDGHTVSNLKVIGTTDNTGANNRRGFFGNVQSGKIQNLSISNADVSGSLYVGAIAGQAYTSVISNCTVTGSVNVRGWWYIGGITGGQYVNIYDSAVTGNTGSSVYSVDDSGSYVGGIYGFHGEGSYVTTNCTVNGLTIHANDRVGGIGGIAHYSNSIVDCTVENTTIYSKGDNNNCGLIAGADQSTSTETAKLVDNVVGANATASAGTGTDLRTVTTQVGAANNGGTLKTADDCAMVGSDIDYDASGKVVGGTFEKIPESALAEGFGPVANEQGLYTVEALPLIATVTTGGTTKNYYDLHKALEAGKAAASVVTLLADVDLNNESWTPVGTSDDPFCGSFDGNGKTISNLYVNNSTGDGVGLFGRLTGSGTVQNLVISNVNLSAKVNVGALVGSTGNSYKFIDITVTGTIVISGNKNVGGMIGQMYGSLSGCSVVGVGDGNLIKGIYGGDNYEGESVGGLVGYFREDASASNCTVKGVTLEGNGKVGGLFGSAYEKKDIAGVNVENIKIVCAPEAGSDAYTYVTTTIKKMGFGGIVGLYSSGYNTGTLSGTVSGVDFEFGEALGANPGQYVSYGLVTGGHRTSDTLPANPAPTYYSTEAYAGLVAKGYDAAKYSNDYLINNYVATVTDAEGAFVGGYSTVDDALKAVKTLVGATVNIFAGEYTLTTTSYTFAKDVTVIGATDDEGNNLVTIKSPFNVNATDVTLKDFNIVCAGNGLNECSFSGLIEHVNISGNNGTRNCYVKTDGVVTFKNCVITGQVYGIHFDGGTRGTVNIIDCTITGWTSFGSAISQITMTDTRFETGTYNYIRFYQDAVIDDCSFNENMVVDVANSVNGTASLVISDSTVDGGKAVEDMLYAGDVTAEAVAIGTNITFDEDGNINGGLFDVIGDRLIADGYISIDNPDSETSANYPLTVGGPYEAIVLDENGALKQGYATLAAAIAAAQEGDTVKLIADVVYELTSTSKIGVTIDKSITLDGNGHKITLTGGYAGGTYGINVDSTAAITPTFKNLTIAASGIERAVRFSGAAGGTLDNVTLTTDAVGIHIKGTGDVEISNSSITTKPNDNTHYTAHLRSAVMHGSSATVTLTDNTIVAQAEISSADMNHKAKGVYIGTGAVGTMVLESGNAITADIALAIDGAETGAGAGPSNKNHLIVQAGNTVTGAWGSPSGYAYKLVTVNGGDYNNLAIADLITLGKTDSNGNLQISVTGGTFPIDVTAYCAEGYTCVPSEDRYVVQVAAGKVARNVEQNKAYASLADALAAAANGQTVMLLKDVEEQWYPQSAVPSNLTIDLGGNTLTGRIVGWQQPSMGGLVVKNGTISSGDNAPLWFYGSGAITAKDLTIVSNEGAPNMFASGSSKLTLQNVVCKSTLEGDIVAESGTYYNDPTMFVASGYLARKGTDASDVECWTIEPTPDVKLTLQDGTVTTYRTVSEAVAAAATAGQTATVETFEGTYEIPATISIPEGLTLKGAGAETTVFKITTTNGDGVKITKPNVTISNATINGAAIASRDFTSLINVEADGVVVDGVVMVGGGSATWSSSILVESLTSDQRFTVKNSTISGSFRGVLRESCNANIVIENCDIDAVYPFNIDGGNGGTVTVADSALHGWTSYSGVDSVTFTSCEFSKAKSGYDRVVAYVDTTFDGCTFDSDFEIYAKETGFTFELEDCTKNDVALTWEKMPDNFGDANVWNKCTCLVDGERVAFVAQIGDTYYNTLQKALNAAAAATVASEPTVEVLVDEIDCAGWTPVTINSKSKLVTLDGKDVVLKNLSAPLFNKTGSGCKGVVVKNVTVEGANISTSSYASAFLPYADSTETAYFENCHIVDSTITSTGTYAGGFVAYAAGYNIQNDGPVFSTVTIKDCSVKNSTITGGNSTGALMGHATGSAWTLVNVDGTEVTGNAIVCTDDSNVKAGALFGTVGAAGQESYGQTGGIVVGGDTVVKDNTMTSNGVVSEQIFGRIGSSGGKIEVTGGTYDGTATYANNSYDHADNKMIVISGGTFQTQPSQDAIADGYVAELSQDVNGWWTVGGPFVAKIGNVGYATLAEAANAAVADDTVEILAAEISEGSVKFPATLKNVTIKPADGVTATLTDMTLTSADGSAVDYEGITIDGLVFDNSRILFTGQRTGEVVYKDWTIANCTFTNIVSGTTAAVHFGSFKAGETMDGLTFTNNVIDGVSGESRSGLLVNRMSGDVLIEGNLITNVAWNAIQLLNAPEGSTVTITNNLLSSKAEEGVINLYGNKAGMTISENAIIGDGAGVANVAYLSTAVDVAGNCWGGGEPALSGTQEGGSILCANYYASYSYDEATRVLTFGDEVGAVAVLKTGDTVKGMHYSLNAAVAASTAGDTIMLLDNVTQTEPLDMTKSYTLDFNGKTIYYNTTATTLINSSSNVIFKNGKLDISGCAISSSTAQGLLIFKFNSDGNALTFDKMELYGKNCRTYGIFSFPNSTNGSTVNFINGSRISIENESNLDYSDLFKGLGSTYPYVVNITDSTVSCTNVTRFSLYGTVNVKDSTVTFTGGENAFRQGAFTFDHSTVTVSGAKAGEGKGIVPRFSDTVVTNGSVLTFIGSNIGKDVLFEFANNIVIYDTSSVTAASVSGAAADRAIIAPPNYSLVTTDNGGESVTYSITPAVARIGNTYYATFEDAVEAYQEGDTITVVGYDDTMEAPEGWKFVTDDTVDPAVTTLVQTDPNVSVTDGTTTKTYETLQQAFNAAHEMSGDVTVTMLTDLAECALIHQKAGLNVTVDGQGKTLTGQIIIDGNGRLDGTDTLTITGINFVGTASDLAYGDTFVVVSNDKANHTGGLNSYAHCLMIANCTFTGDASDPTSLVGFRTQANGGSVKNLTVTNVVATQLHSLAQLTGSQDVTFVDCTVTDCENGVNVSGGNGTYAFTGNTFDVSTTDGYGIRLKDATTAVAVLEGNTIAAKNALALGKNDEANNKGVFEVKSGTYNGALLKKTVSADAKFVISGGYFPQAVLSEYCAANYIPADAPDGPLPYTVVETVPGGFVYPIEGSANGLPIPTSWLAENASDIYGTDKTAPVLASMTNALVQALSATNANDMPVWQSYVLGTAALRINAVPAANDNTNKKVTISAGVNIPDELKRDDATTTVTFRLAARNDDGTWTDVEGCTGAATPSFDVALDDVAGKVLAIFADIVTE